MGNRLEGKVAVVTGSRSGNSRAIALAFTREGAADVCKLALYLASDDAEMVANSMQVLDGGYDRVAPRAPREANGTALSRRKKGVVA